MELDAFELCSPELQNKLTPMREKFKAFEDSLVEESCNVKANSEKGDNVNKKMKQEPFSFKDGKTFDNNLYFMNFMY